MAYPSSATGFTSVKAVGATSFINTIGVNTHLNYTDTVYGNVGAVSRSLDYLGIDKVRDFLPEWLKGPYQQLASQGVQFDFFFPGAGKIPAYVKTLSDFEKANPGAVQAIEGANEVNYWPVAAAGGTSLSSQAAFQKSLFDAINADPTLKNVPVFNMTLGGVGDDAFKQLGNMSASADYANVHIYYGQGSAPNAYWDYAIRLGQIPMPSAGMTISETGYSTAVNNANREGVDEVTQAKYLLDVLMDAAKAGIKATNLYELVDLRNDPGKTSKENNFGLFHNDWTPKVAATAIHNLTTILTDGVGTVSALSTLAYNVTGLSAVGKHMLFQEANGVQDIVVWSEPDIWDEAGRKGIAVAGQQVTITLPTAVTGYAVYDPMKGTSAVTTGGPTNSITVTVTDHPLIIELKSDTGTTTSPTTPSPTIAMFGVSPSPGAAVTPVTTEAGADYTISGVPRIDQIAGGVTRHGDTGGNVLNGTNASDLLRGWNGNDSLSGGGGGDNITGDNGNDSASGGAGGDWIVGGIDQDLLRGDDGNDIIYGNFGNDTIDGGIGNDTLRGGKENDVVTGGGGNDWMSGDRGNDTLTGGDGADIFHLFRGGGADRITDFSSAAGDRIQLDAGVSWTLKFSGSDTLISTGDGDQIVLVGVSQSSLGSWLTA